MALTVKHNKARHTHENEQFRRVASSLKYLFEGKKWSGLLIGNPYNDLYSRFRPDAILLYDYGLLIIDFKDYSGLLTLPVNKENFVSSRWYIESHNDDKRILVRAGNRFINPFIQLNNYRGVFKEIVQNELLLRGFIDESRTGAINIFSSPLTIENYIPKEFPFYKITQESDFGNLLYDYTSENRYNEDIAVALSKIFEAQNWTEHIEVPIPQPIVEDNIVIKEDVEVVITSFLKNDGNGILVMESLSAEDRDSWVKYVNKEAIRNDIPQTETWIYSSRISRIVSSRIGVEIDSIFGTIYGGKNSFKDEEDFSANEEQADEILMEVVPIRESILVDQKALIVLHEAHLITRSLHQTELLRFGTGRLLDDLFTFLDLKNTKRKLICIGDPYSMTYGKVTECALNLTTLSDMYDGTVNHFKQPLPKGLFDGKLGLRIQLADCIDNDVYNNLKYPYKPDDMIEINAEEKDNKLAEWYGTPMESEPHSIAMVYDRNSAHRINLWIKNNCLKSGNDLSSNDLLITHNSVKIPDETGFHHPTSITSGMFLLVLKVDASVTKLISPKQLRQSVLLSFRKLKVKCLSIPNTPHTDVWISDNYFKNQGKLSKEEAIAFRVFVSMLVSEHRKKHPFSESDQYVTMQNNPDYLALLDKEKELHNQYDKGERVKEKLGDIRVQIRKIENLYIKSYRERILSKIIATDPLVNTVYATYGWALTVHRSMGYTFNNSILNTQIGARSGIMNEGYFRWLYSAITTTSDTLYVINPQEINPMMDTVFEGTSKSMIMSVNDSKKYLAYSNYQPGKEYIDVIPKELRDHIKGSICELSKLLKPLDYLLVSVHPAGDYLTKVHFGYSNGSEKDLVILLDNKGPKNDYQVSSIRIDKGNDSDNIKVLDFINHLFDQTNEKEKFKALPLPTDFRGSVYKRWISVFEEKGFELIRTEAHNYQDIFIVIKEFPEARFRVWYNKEGFFSKLQILEKSEEHLGEIIKECLLNVN